MRYYRQPHAFYAGIDLHARTMFTHILDRAGRTVFERNLPASPDAFRQAVAPNPRRSRFLRAFAGVAPLLSGGRARCFAWPDRRHGEVSGASPVDGDRRRSERDRGPDPVKL
jgi:hypothetical protein